jgi:hypothetical protein
MSGITASGENKAWEILATLDPQDVCKTASVLYDRASGSYLVKSFGMDFYVSPGEKKIFSHDPASGVLLERLGDFFRLSMLWYLVKAKDVICAGGLVKLQNIRGGDIFTKGSHVLPLDKIAQKYGNDINRFIEKGKEMGGEVLPKQGDASVKLLPFPRLPAVMTLWIADEEFPASADLMFDSTCELQLPTDIIWSIALMTVLIML